MTSRMASTDRAASKRRAAIYREAARRIEAFEEYFTCCAIHRVSHERYGSPVITQYVSTFAENEDRLQEQFGYVDAKVVTEGRELRVLALCFMAAMVEAGDA